MKKLALTFLLLLGLASVARAEKEPEILILPMAAECLPWDRMDEILDTEFGETPFVTGEGQVFVRMPDAMPRVDNYLLIYLNTETYTYTIVSVFPDDMMACVLTSGIDFRPFDR